MTLDYSFFHLLLEERDAAEESKADKGTAAGCVTPCGVLLLRDSRRVFELGETASGIEAEDGTPFGEWLFYDENGIVKEKRLPMD